MEKLELRKYFAKELKFGWYLCYSSQTVFNFLISAAEFCENGIILDAGAGRQRYKPFFEKSIYITQEHEAGIKFKNMQNIEYDLISPIDEKIPLRDNSLDGILSTSVVEHLRYPANFFSEACRVLKPGGKLFVNVPFVHPEHETPFDFNRPTRFGLERWFKDAGFSEIIIKPCSSSIETICSFLPFSIQNDILRTHKSGRQIISSLKKSKNGYIKIISKLPFLFIARCSYFLVNFFCVLIKFLMDKGPYDDVNFTTGWISVATKPGNLDKSLIFKDKNEFLNSCKISK